MSFGRQTAPEPSLAALWCGIGALAAALAGSVALTATGHAVGVTLFEGLMALVAASSAAYLLWHTPPAYVLSLALFASVFSGNWSAMGLPSGFPPDHILEAIAVLLVLARAPGLGNRRVRVTPVHWLMGAGLLYVAINDLAANGHIASTFNLLDGFGLFPFLFFLVAPTAFQTARERNVLLVTLVCLGAYLGFTAVMEILHVNGLVFPKYILNPLVGDPATANRVRGPFAAAVQDGFGLYACAVACAVAIGTWKRPGPRLVAAAVGILCLFGTLLTEQRSVWIATAVATVLVLVVVPRLRAWALPAVALGAAGVALALAVIPGLSSNAQSRLSNSEPVWERLNLDVAAKNMIEAKPLFGFGWGRFEATSQPYFRESGSYPLVYTTVVHDVYLGFGAELGIVGLALWLLIVIFGIGGVVMRPPPPELRSWRYGLIAYAAFYLIVIAFVPVPTSLPPLFLWLVAGMLCTPGPAAAASRRLAAVPATVDKTMPASRPAYKRTAGDGQSNAKPRLEVESWQDAVAARLETFAEEYEALRGRIPPDEDTDGSLREGMKGEWAGSMIHLGARVKAELRRNGPGFVAYWDTKEGLPSLVSFAGWANVFIDHCVHQLNHVASRLRQGHDAP